MTATLSPVVRELIIRRKSLGLRQADVAERMRRSQQNVNRWERGRTDPSLRNLENWCLALGTPLLLGSEKVERNRKILSAVQSGRKVGEVAREFGVSRRTVTYLKSGRGWMRKSRAQLGAS